MPAKKFKPPPIVTVTPEDLPPEWMARIDALPKKLKRTYVFNVIGWRLSMMGCFIAEPGRIEEAMALAWPNIEAAANCYRQAYKDRDEKVRVERAEREAYWAKEKVKRDRERAKAKAKAEGKMSKRISRRDEIRWVDDRLGRDDVQPDDAPTPWCFDSWNDYHGTAESRDVFRTKFSKSIIENDKAAENASRKANKSEKTLAMLDEILEAHIGETSTATTPEAGSPTT
jgi:hypothetical protein